MPEIELTPDGFPKYVPDGEVLRQFLLARNEVDIIRGPIGSGSSSASVMRLWSQAVEQRPFQGVRYSRWAVVRNTYLNLRDTTLKTWQFWLRPELFGPVAMSRPFVHHIQLPPGVDPFGRPTPAIDLEVIFIALDDEKDIAKLRSLELTGVWINEVEFLGKPIFDEIQSRCGRYPPIAWGGPSWYGVICDMNAPGEDHWVPLLMGDVPMPEEFTEAERMQWRRPPGWGYFVQPPGMLEVLDAEGQVVDYTVNPKAENTKWLPGDYYPRIIKGKSKTWIDSRIMNRITLYVEGDPVFPSFTPELHVSRASLTVNKDFPALVGLDFGRNPAAVFGQHIDGRLLVQHELVGRNEGASRFAPRVKSVLEKFYAGCPEFHLWGDPRGQDHTQSDDRTPYDIYRTVGLRVRAAPFEGLPNALSVRLEAVDHMLGRLVNGRPALLISSPLRALKMAMAGGYRWAKTGDGKKVPEKDRHSDIADALQYLILGIGEGRRMINLPEPGKVVPIQAYRGLRKRRRGAL